MAIVAYGRNLRWFPLTRNRRLRWCLNESPTFHEELWMLTSSYYRGLFTIQATLTRNEERRDEFLVYNCSVLGKHSSCIVYQVCDDRCSSVKVKHQIQKGYWTRSVNLFPVKWQHYCRNIRNAAPFNNGFTLSMSVWCKKHLENTETW